MSEQSNLVGNGLSVASTLGNHAHGNGAGTDGRAGNAEGVHDGLAG